MTLELPQIESVSELIICNPLTQEAKSLQTVEKSHVTLAGLEILIAESQIEVRSLTAMDFPKESAIEDTD